MAKSRKSYIGASIMRNIASCKSTLKIVVLISSIALLFLCQSCTTYKGAKIVEGTDLAVGINVPSTDGTLQLQLLNYLSGFRLGIAQDAALTMTYSINESNSYFANLIHTDIKKTISATVSPTEKSDDNDD